jgi:hypothetical protein
LRLCRNRINAHRTHTNIHASVGFEPTIAVLGLAKTVSALDRAATAIGIYIYIYIYIYILLFLLANRMTQIL